MGIEKNISKVLQKHEEISVAYLYGSIAKGTTHKDSDIDIGLLLSDEFEPDALYTAKISREIEENLDLNREADVRILNERGKLPFSASKIGKWWYKEKEIDIIALGSENSLFAECKWSKNPVDYQTLNRLREKTLAVDVLWKKHYAIFSRSGFTEELVEENVLLYDLEKLEGIYEES